MWTKDSFLEELLYSWEFPWEDKTYIYETVQSTSLRSSLMMWSFSHWTGAMLTCGRAPHQDNFDWSLSPPPSRTERSRAHWIFLLNKASCLVFELFGRPHALSSQSAWAHSAEIKFKRSSSLVSSLHIERSVMFNPNQKHFSLRKKFNTASGRAHYFQGIMQTLTGVFCSIRRAVDNSLIIYLQIFWEAPINLWTRDIMGGCLA